MPPPRLRVGLGPPAQGVDIEVHREWRQQRVDIDLHGTVVITDIPSASERHRESPPGSEILHDLGAYKRLVYDSRMIAHLMLIPL